MSINRPPRSRVCSINCPVTAVATAPLDTLACAAALKDCMGQSARPVRRKAFSPTSRPRLVKRQHRFGQQLGGMSTRACPSKANEWTGQGSLGNERTIERCSTSHSARLMVSPKWGRHGFDGIASGREACRGVGTRNRLQKHNCQQQSGTCCLIK